MPMMMNIIKDAFGHPLFFSCQRYIGGLLPEAVQFFAFFCKCFYYSGSFKV